jgi:hypothetical protein
MPLYRRSWVSNLARPRPPGYGERIGPSQEQPKPGLDFVQVFVKDQAAVDRHAATALRWLSPAGLLWFTYPKKTGAIKSDITRDHGWEALYEAGWRPVTQIAIDQTWSALRFRPASEVKAQSRFDPAERRERLNGRRR